MELINKIRQKPQAAKIKIMWTVSIVVVVLLVLVWIISSRYHKNTDKDFSLFKTIGQGVKDVKNNYKK